MTLTYEQALTTILNFDDPYQRALRDHGKQTWGLSGILQLLEKLGNPHLSYPTIHIAGTKGKGSTAAFVAQGLMEAGLKTGLYISPHLQDWRERIQINREMIPREALAAIVEDILPYVEGTGLTSFEVTTALAFWHFAREECDVAVIEVGLGGRLDATNVVKPVVSAITNISLDHTQLLGNTLIDIAYEKAEIIKAGRPVVSAPQAEPVERVLRKVAANKKSALHMVGKDWWFQPVEMDWDGSMAFMGSGDYKVPVEIGMPGGFQIENAAVALEVLNVAAQEGLPISRQARISAMANTRWPGRLELVQQNPHVIIDSAHNPHSVEQVVHALEELSTGEQAGGRRVFVFGCMADKDVDGMLEILLRHGQRIVLPSADTPRAASAEDLLARAEALHEQMRASSDEDRAGVELLAASTIDEAVRLGLDGLEPHDVLCITGSLAVAGEARDELVGKPE
ncbi:MAG: bifunctional folylpolyglutamate synthase/dihydrofolate synthase [Chloroflexi bacterium]|nr:bifunctional folylpolyglutamate synthase/dihydrofolate synthase [Chloroflexota bacterium]